MDAAALLAHIVSQTRQNVEFLVSHKQLSPADGRDILARLPNAPGSGPANTMVALETQTHNLLIGPPPVESPRYSQLPGPQLVRTARALWAHNEDGRNPNDISFRAGDTIEIVEETNPDWWTGRHNGRQGLFPSNYVEKFASSPPPKPYQARNNEPYASPSPSNAPMPPFPGPGLNQPPYQPPSGPHPGGPAGPYGAPPPVYPPLGGTYPSPGGPPGGYQPAYQPPPPQMYNTYNSPPPSAMVVSQPAQVSQAAVGPPPAVPPKKSKFGNLGNTLAQSAVGGVGFGAGNAIGSNLVNSIF